MMAQFGRDEWRSQGETFTVWFRLLGRLAALARWSTRTGASIDGRSGAACSSRAGRRADVTLVAFGVSSIIFDGLSQTQTFFDLFGAPGDPRADAPPVRLHRASSSCSPSRSRARSASARSAPACCRSPSATSIAHYLTYLLIDGQRILIAISDPFQRGWNLFGTAFHAADRRLAAARARLDDPARRRRRRAHARRVGRARRGRRGRPAGITRRRHLRRRQVPLAVVMVGLTTLTLWSLGQAIVVAPAEGASGQAPAVARL